MPIEKMRSGIKLLSLSARRELVRRRPLPGRNFSQVRALHVARTDTETSGDRLKVFPGITTNYRIHSTTNRCFRSLSKSFSPDDFEGDRNLDEDIDSLVFNDETATDVGSPIDDPADLEVEFRSAMPWSHCSATR